MRTHWLIRLYPRAWRDRYGAEMTAVLGDTRLTPTVILDLVAGALDARLMPQPIAASGTEKERAMFTNMMKRCAVGPSISARDQLIGAAVMLGSSFLFALGYVAASARYPENEFVDAFGIMAFPAALLLSMPFTYLTRHSRRTQVVIVVGSLLLLMVMAYLAALV